MMFKNEEKLKEKKNEENSPLMISLFKGFKENKNEKLNFKK